MIKSLKKYGPLIILILSGLIFSYHFTERYDLPVHDEATYTKAFYRYHGGWAPLYLYLYSVLKDLTHSAVSSFHIILFYLSFLIVPLTIFSVSIRLRISKSISSILGFAALISFWNFPSEPKIQVLSFCFVALTFVVRWSPGLKNQVRLILFYSLMVLSLYLRQDNLIIIQIFAFYDLIFIIRDRQIKTFFQVISASGAIYLLCYMMFRSPFKAFRSLHAFLDHFFWKNSYRLRDVLPGKEHFEVELDRFFGHPTKLTDALLAQPENVLIHFQNNFNVIHIGLLKNFEFLLNTPQWVIGIFFVVIMFFQSKDDIPSDTSSNKIEIALAAVAFSGKSFLMALLLQPWPKYLFELNIVLMLAFGLFIPKLSERFPKIPKFKYLYLLMPLLLTLHSFDQKQFTNNFDMTYLLRTLEEENSKRPIKTIIGNQGIASWQDNRFNLISLHIVRNYDQIIKKDLREFLSVADVDIIVLEHDYRYILESANLGPEFKDFESNYQNYGFYIISGEPFKNLTIYRKK